MFDLIATKNVKRKGNIFWRIHWDVAMFATKQFITCGQMQRNIVYNSRMNQKEIKFSPKKETDYCEMKFSTFLDFK